MKSAQTFSSHFFKTLAWFQDVSTLPIANSYVIYGGDTDWELEHGKLLSWQRLSEIIS